MSFDAETSKFDCPSGSPEMRFELLSAYVDNELTATEKLQVEEWLLQDPQYRHQYQHLLKIKKLLMELPIPTAEKHGCQVAKVMARIEKRSRQRLALGTAIVAVIVGAIGSIFALEANHKWSIANQLENKEEQLMLAMEKPIIPMPSSLTGN